ncbi:hypothetical protein JCM33374_g3349 [Metschnikowia sp. JCM 33374]|nr:hypothetical protein JCM33374_g3349 [Metschnikowia sp. JCM 33374]
MTLITILEGSFGGPKIYENKQYVSPNFARAQIKQQAADQARSRANAAVDRKVKLREQVLKVDPLSNASLFKTSQQHQAEIWAHSALKESPVTSSMALPQQDSPAPNCNKPPSSAYIVKAYLPVGRFAWLRNIRQQPW